MGIPQHDFPIGEYRLPPTTSESTPQDSGEPSPIEVHIPKKEKPPRTRYRLAGPAPTQGVRGLLWRTGGAWLYSLFGWQWLSQLSLADRHRNALNTLWEQRHNQKIVAFVNSKGGSGKTALTVWLSALLADAIKRHIVAFDANENTGHTASRLGIDRSNTIQLRKLIAKRDELHTLASFIGVTDWHRQTGVTVVASEAATISRITHYSFAEALTIVKANAHTVMCDCGNGIPHPANRGSVELADTLVFPGNAASGDSLRDITNTMAQYCDPKFGIAHKVRQGIIVVIGDKPERRHEYANRFEHPLERTFVVPTNSYMAHDHPVDITKIPLGIKVVLLEILVAIMRDGTPTTDS